MPLIKIIGQTVLWSVFERKDILAKIYSLSHSFGIPSHFLTISPSTRHNIVALRLSLKKVDREKNTTTEKEFLLPTITDRTRIINNNPAVATYIIYRLIEKFFELIVGLPIKTFSH